MITKIRVSNFYSIGEEIELSFLKGGKKEEGGYFSYKKNEKISLINGFFGANASGKSNLLRSMVSIVKNIYTVYSPSEGSGDVLLCRSNMSNDFKNKPTTLGADFLFGNNYYIYNLTIKEENDITEEKLYVKNLEVKGANPKEIFTRTNLKISFGPDYKELENYLSIAKVQKYQTFISHLINNVGAKAVIDFIDFRNTNAFFLKTDDFDLLHHSPAVIFNNAFRLNFFKQEKKEEFLKFTKDIMSCFDDSIEDIEISTENKNASIMVTHKNFSKGIGIMQESAGTRELFCHIYDILNAFKNGGIVIYDETNRYYHPDIEVSLLSLFNNKEFNTKNAQLFFSSHNHDTFDLLQLDQAYIVEKKDSGSFAYKLSEVENLKKRDSLKKKYRLGMLGGTPDISTFDYKLKQLL